MLHIYFIYFLEICQIFGDFFIFIIGTWNSPTNYYLYAVYFYVFYYHQWDFLLNIKFTEGFGTDFKKSLFIKHKTHVR